MRLLNQLLDHGNRNPPPADRNWDPVLNYIEETVKPPSLEELASIMNLSESQFKFLFKEHCGITPSEYITRRRIEHSKKYLMDPNDSITDTAFEMGFSSSQYFSSVFNRFRGLSPKEFRKLKYEL